MEEVSNPQQAIPTEGQSQEEADNNLRLEVAHEGPALSLVIPTEALILKEAYRLATDRNVSVRDLATCVSQDPVLILELLRAANSTLFSQDRPATTVAENAVVQLGSARVVEILAELAQRAIPPQPEVVKELENLRSRARRTSIVARILAMTNFKGLAAEAQTIALMSNMGHLIACLHFGLSYAQLASRISRGTLTYRMLHDQSFNVHRIQMAYLRRAGFPEILLFALDRELTCKTPHRMPLRHIVEGASELVEAFDAGKWQKFSPEKELPLNSALRFLRFDPAQYKKVWERCDEYLSLAQAEAEMQRLNPAQLPAGGIHVEETSSLALGVIQQAVAPAAETPEAPEPVAEIVQPPLESVEEIVEPPTEVAASAEHVLAYPSSLFGEDGGTVAATLKQKPKTEFSMIPQGGTFLFPVAPPRTFEEVESFVADDKPLLNSDEAKLALESLCELVKNANKTRDLLENLLELLITSGPFVRSGIFVVAEHGRSARLLRANGEDLSAGQEVIFADPLCPLAACLNQIRSFNAQGVEDISSPLGVSAYAVSPLNVQNSTPVFLYADCGPEGAMNFESRRLFRYVVGLINQTLPKIEPGLPVDAFDA